MKPDELVRQLARADGAGRTEADIQSDIKNLLMSGDFGLDDYLREAKLEVPTGDGTRRRIDIEVGATVIEVKKNLDKTGVRDAAVEQLSGYVRSRMQLEGSSYNGILTDGRHWFLYEINPANDALEQRAEHVLSANPGTASTLTEWLQSVLATQVGVIPNAKSIESFLGSTSPAYLQDHQYLSGLCSRLSDDPTVALKRGLWARLLRSALGADAFDDDTDLFMDHTLLVIEATAIGHAIMGFPVQDMIANPAGMLDGEGFRSHGLENVVEPGFFDWFLAEPDGQQLLKRVIRRINVFDWSSTEHDVLKVLYESIITAKTRKSLGEYYTPDWLAEGIVTKCIEQPLSQRVLDPSCGSGTFLFHAIRRFIRAAEDKQWDNTQILRGVQEHVFGLDIHPVSVALARITYLLAIGERLTQDRDTLTIPVHLGDSIQWAQDTSANEHSIKIEVDGEDLTPQAQQQTLLDVAQILTFPLAGIDDPGTFDNLVRDLTALAQRHTDPAAKIPSLTPLLNRFSIPTGTDANVLLETFRVLCDLNAAGRDSIWGYFVRNQVRPLWLSLPGRRVDVLIGNPPWVAYRNMTKGMQRQFQTFSRARNLWHGATVATHQDLVGLFIVRAVELYLKDGGTFGFVTPLAVLSRQQYEGFRAGRWGSPVLGDIGEMWDLDGITPRGFFPVPAGVIFGHRRTSDYTHGAPEGQYGSPGDKQVVRGRRDTSGWEATRTNLTFTTQLNTSLSNDEVSGGSPYAKQVTQGATIVPRYAFFVEEEETTTRLGQAAGRVRVRSLRSRLEKPPYKDLPDIVGTVEKQFIHPVHLGATITPFRALPPTTAVLPITKQKLLTPKEVPAYPGLSEWWDRASDDWDTHKTKKSKLDLFGQIDYRSKLSQQLNGSTHRVLYSKSGNTLVAVRINNPHLIVDHKLYWLSARSVDEARYLTAILNAPATTIAVSRYQSRGLFGARDFDKYVWRLSIPTYDPTNDTHLLLTAIATDAEEVAASVALPPAEGFQRSRAHIRAALDRSGIHAELDATVTELLGLGDVVEAATNPHLEIKATAIRNQVALTRLTTGPDVFNVPDIEIDIDCEFDTKGVYLWGATLSKPDKTPTYQAFGTPDGDEKVTAQAFFAWLSENIAEADANGRTVEIFHYGHAESSHLERILGEAAKSATNRFTDMLPLLRHHYFAPNGFTLKSLAPLAGATWRSTGATGRDTLDWVKEARDDSPKAWQQLVDYNEDDTRATRTLRHSLSTKE